MRRLVGLAVLGLLLLAPALTAQQTDRRPLTLADYGDWSRITGTTLSPDGRWLAWVEDPNEGDATLQVRELDGETVHEGMNASDLAFSSDAQWVAYLSAPPEEEAEALREERKPVPQVLHLIDLSSGVRTEEGGVRAFSFSEDGTHLALHKTRPDGEAEHTGSDLLLRDLENGTMLAFGNVSEYGFDETSEHLAYLVDADGEAGNGLYLVALGEGRIRSVDSGPYRYEDLIWS